MRWSSWLVRLPWVILGVSVALAGASIALGLAGDAGLITVFLIAVLGPVFGVTGALVASRRPRNAVGWILCMLAVSFEMSGFADTYVAYDGDRTGGSLPGWSWVAWASEWFLNIVSPALIILCFLLFPTGRLPSARWRPLIWTVVVVAVVYAASAALAPGPLANYPVENPAGLESADGLRTLARVSLQVLIVPLMFVSAVSLLVRLRRSSGTERQQIKWFVYAAALLATELLAANALLALLGEAEEDVGELIFFVVFLIVLSGIPVAMGVAILKHRLYDIDVIVNRTLVYGALTVMLALVYFGSVVSLQYVFRAFTGGNSQLVIVASTLAIAALFNPLRGRVQSFVDRLFYRKKYDAGRVLAEFSTLLKDETNLDSLSEDLTSVVRETLQPARVSLWLREPDREVKR